MKTKLYNIIYMQEYFVNVIKKTTKAEEKEKNTNF
jgi:hypothetical protein